MERTSFAVWKERQAGEPAKPLTLDLLNPAWWGQSVEHDRPALYWSPATGVTTEKPEGNVLSEAQWLERMASSVGATADELRAELLALDMEPFLFIVAVLRNVIEKEKL
jgi:hypothetical protein